MPLCCTQALRCRTGIRCPRDYIPQRERFVANMPAGSVSHIFACDGFGFTHATGRHIRYNICYPEGSLIELESERAAREHAREPPQENRLEAHRGPRSIIPREKVTLAKPRGFCARQGRMITTASPGKSKWLCTIDTGTTHRTYEWRNSRKLFMPSPDIGMPFRSAMACGMSLKRC